MGPVLGILAAVERLAEVGVDQHVLVGPQGLSQNFLAVRDEEEPQIPAERLPQALVVQRGHHRLARSGRGYQQIPVSAMHLSLDLSRSSMSR